MNAQTRQQIEKLGADAWMFCSSIEGTENLCKRIVEILVSDEMVDKAKEKGYNIFDYVSTDPVQPVLNCVHCENGMYIACDTQIMIVETAEYAPDFEGKNINRYAQIVEGRYPNWQAVIPADDYVGFEAMIDAQKLRKELAIQRKQAKLEGIKKPNIFVRVSNPEGGASIKMNAEKLELLVRYIKAKGIDEPIKFNYQRACKVTDGKNVAIVMPCNWQEKESEFDFVDVRLTER